MNKRLLGSILIVTFFILSVSGILMYIIPFKRKVASLHTFFALLFLIGVIFHIANNKFPLFNYISGKNQKKIKKFQSPFIFLILLLISIGFYLENPVLNSVYNWGNQFRNKQIGKTEETFDYQIIELSKTVGEQKVSIEFKKGKSFKYPLFAVWIEDSIGNYIETLYISKAISSSIFKEKTKVNGKWEAGIVRRPGALAYWSHKRGIKASDSLYTPLYNSSDLDAASGATPTNNFIIRSKSNFNNLSNYKILLEVNQSFDWNEYYIKDKYADYSVYSETVNVVGQPSLIYSAKISSNDLSLKNIYIMNLIGHGHHSGKNGKLYTDLKNITTAKMIADRIIVTIE